MSRVSHLPATGLRTHRSKRLLADYIPYPGLTGNLAAHARAASSYKTCQHLQKMYATVEKVSVKKSGQAASAMLAASESKNTMINSAPSQKRCIVFHLFWCQNGGILVAGVGSVRHNQSAIQFLCAHETNMKGNPSILDSWKWRTAKWQKSASATTCCWVKTLEHGTWDALLHVVCTLAFET